MLIPVLVLIFLVLLGLVSRRYFGTANRPLFLALLFIVLLLLSGLRNKSVGVDTAAYVGRFQQISELNYSNAKLWVEPYSDKTFYIVSWLFSRVIPNAQVWIAFISLIYLIGVAFVCYWESPDYAFSMLYVYCMGLFFFSMTGIRQSFALGMIMMSYIFVVKRQFIPFLIIILLARLMHQSAIIFLVIYPIANMRTGWARLLLVMIFFIIVLAFRNTIGTWILERLPEEIVDQEIAGYMKSTTQYTASGFAIQLFMFAFCMRYHKDVVSDVPHREVLYNLAFFGLVFQAAAMSIAEFFRASMYFNWTYMVLIPICMQYEPDQRNYEFVRLMVIVAFTTYFFYSTLGSCGIVPYRFFWQLAESGGTTW